MAEIQDARGHPPSRGKNNDRGRPVGAGQRSLGESRDLREPDEVFQAILNEGEEVSLVSNLKLRRGLIHKEPTIELCGADPYKFAELRELGLINEQINWKQRFFVSSDETIGIDILESLLERYPVIITEDEISAKEIVPQAEIRTMEIVDLDQWIVAVGKANPEQQTAYESDRQVDAAEPDGARKEESPSALTQEAAVSWTQFRQSGQTQLAFSFG